MSIATDTITRPDRPRGRPDNTATRHRRRRAGALTVTAALLAGAVVGLADTQTVTAHPTTPTATFDPPTTGWYAYPDQTPDEFDDALGAMVDDGQMMVDLDVDTFGGDERRAGIFHTNPDDRMWVTRTDLDDETFVKEWNYYRGLGLRLSEFEAYLVDGEEQFATSWIENVEDLGWSAVRGLEREAFLREADVRRRGRMMPVDVDVYYTPDGFRYASVWVENPDSLAWKLEVDADPDDFLTLYDTHLANGFRMHTIESTVEYGWQTLAGIWVENRNGRGSAAGWNMSATGFRNQWNQMNDMGFRLEDFERYDMDDGVRYSGVWRQNDDRFDWRLRADVDELVDEFLKALEVPGVSVAITHQGKIVYERGFGDQDVDAGVRMHAGTVNRLASISKAITGILTFDVLEDEPGVALTDDIDEFLPSIPLHHVYTLGDTLTNRSCIPSYPDPMTGNMSEHFDTAVDAVSEFMDTQFNTVAPGEPGYCISPFSYRYSTAGHSVTCAALETITGKTTDELIEERLTAAHGVPTLGPDDDSVDDRSKIYATDNTERDPDDQSWKRCGGGMQASAHDLATLGLRLLDGSILSATDREAMWTPIGTYAYGWEVGTADNDGERIVGKAGRHHGANTYWRIYPDDDMQVVVLSNRGWGGHSAQTLSKSIGELMLEKL